MRMYFEKTVKLPLHLRKPIEKWKGQIDSSEVAAVCIRSAINRAEAGEKAIRAVEKEELKRRKK